MEAKLAKLKKSRDASKGHMTKSNLLLRKLQDEITPNLRQTTIAAALAGITKQMTTQRNTFEATIVAAELDADGLSDIQDTQYRDYEEEYQAASTVLEEFQLDYTHLATRVQVLGELEAIETSIKHITIHNDSEGRRAARRIHDYVANHRQLTLAHSETLRTDEYLKEMNERIVQQLEMLCTQIPEETVMAASLARVEETRSGSLPRRHDVSDSYDRDRDHGDRYNHRRGLPKLDIPIFTGNIHEFPYWWKQFDKFVHQDGKFDESDKLTYLKQTYQSPNDLIILDNKGAGPGLYDSYIHQIQAIYDRPRLVHRHHVKELFDVQPMTDGSTKQLKRLYASINNSVLKLEATGQYTIDAILTSHVELLMTPTLRGKWKEQTASVKRVPPVKELLAFLLAKKYTQDEVEDRDFEPVPIEARQDQPYRNRKGRSGQRSPTPVKRDVMFNDRTWPNCKLCPEVSHAMYLCPTYLGYTLKQRIEYVKKEKLCGNCLGGSHITSVCRNSYRCRECGAKHNTTLHQDETVQEEVHVAKIVTTKRSNTISPTMELTIHADNESQANVTALFDTGASISLVTEDIVNRLGLPQQKTNVQVTGIEGLSSGQRTASTVALKISSPHQIGAKLNTRAFVVPQIGCGRTGAMTGAAEGNWVMLEGLNLANPNFHQFNKLELLLGNDVLGHVELPEVRKSGTLIARNTIFGWVINGQPKDTKGSTPRNQYVCAVTGEQITPDLLAAQETTNSYIQEFFHSEDSPEQSTQTAEDLEALQHFESTHKILSNGRFRVSLPKRKERLTLGFSRPQAIQRFMANEKSLQRKGGFTKFQEVVAEYLELGHAQLVTKPELLKPTEDVYYLPMHAVHKNSTTSPVRVVFDASAATSTGVSLNDTLLTGPTVYPTLTDILLRFRLHNVALTADISKMFREIELDPADRSLHRFVWRKQPNDVLQDYQMNRVTFGVSSSPFLATQTLQQVAANVTTTQPLAAEALKRSFYVDDFLSGTTTYERAILLQRELQQVLERHGLKLRKWRSNSNEVLRVIPEDQQEKEPVKKPYGPHEYLKTLGIHWDAEGDVFRVSTSKLSLTDKVTKRTLASDVAQTYDILGWLAPATIQMKLLIQDLWRSQHDWDDEANDTIRDQWIKWKRELPELAARPIPRQYFFQGRLPISQELHGFSDASLKGYSAVVYLRATYADHPPTVRLVMAKTKVAHVNGITVPRLELCGAKLLAETITTVKDALAMQPTQLHCWCDSQVVLYWLDGNKRINRTYVANRVARTLELVTSERWNHVPGTENPADCASRGISPRSLLHHPLWWYGPPWLAEQPIKFPPQPSLVHLKADEFIVKETVAVVTEQPTPWLTRSFEFGKTRRTLAWVRRFVYNLKAKGLHQEANKGAELTLEEIEQAETYLYLQSQNRMFGGNHPDRWRTDKHTRSLNPKLDEFGVYRVDGRLHNSTLKYSARHHIILKGTDPLTRQIIQHHHLQTLHGGPSQVLTSLSRQYYLVNGMAVVKAACRKCVTCIKFHSRQEKQLMGQLPGYRVRLGHVFDVVGTDFAGPITVNQGNPRKPRKIKAYICVFVCMCTKAIHLEAVMGLSTSDFLACLRRFIGRRGKPSKILSDNGTNYVGASNNIESLTQTLRTKESQGRIIHFCATEKIRWHFNPAKAPHFGGIWEATVKAAKYHLKRVEYRKTFDYQELSTVLCQIEAVLNSRPLMAMHAQSTEGLEVLTAGHFLIGRPLIALPEGRLSQTTNLVKRWDSCQQATQRFWDEWSKDYLQIFHKRSKWQKPARNVEVGDIVLLRDENPYKAGDWPLARVVAVFPGKDGYVRAVDVQAGTAIWRRPIAKLTVMLPVTMEEDDDGSLKATRISPGGGCPSSGTPTSDGKDNRKVSFADTP